MTQITASLRVLSDLSIHAGDVVRERLHDVTRTAYSDRSAVAAAKRIADLNRSYLAQPREQDYLVGTLDISEAEARAALVGIRREVEAALPHLRAIVSSRYIADEICEAMMRTRTHLLRLQGARDAALQALPGYDLPLDWPQAPTNLVEIARGVGVSFTVGQPE